MKRALIIGAGECGVRAAFTLREEGFDGEVALLSAEDVLPYERPPLSKGTDVEAKPIRSADAYDEQKIELRLGIAVEAIDTARSEARLNDGTSIAYDACLIATGAKARSFPTLAGALTLRTLADAQAILGRIRAGMRLGIVGGGFIGLELAATARAAGAEVTVVETASRLMARAVPAPIAAIVEARHRSEGVDLRIGEMVLSADGSSVTLGREALEFDLVVAGVGATPETTLAEAAGLRCDDGIVVDAQMRTSAPGVWAAGDCCRFPFGGADLRLESWRVAQGQGAHAARSMLGATAEFARTPWFWSDQYDLTLQVAGIFDPERGTIERAIGNDASLVFQHDEAGRLVAAAGVGPGLSIAKDIKMAERLIERAAQPSSEALADPNVTLKQLLKAA